MSNQGLVPKNLQNNSLKSQLRCIDQKQNLEKMLVKMKRMVQMVKRNPNNQLKFLSLKNFL